MGGKYFLGGTSTTKVVTFNGASSTGEIVSGDIDTGGRSIVTLVRPQVDNGSGTVSIASRALLSDQVTFGDSVAADSENRCSVRSNGRYHRVKLVPTGDNWKTAIAMDVDVVGQGVR